MTERAKAQWKKYKAMLANATAEIDISDKRIGCNSQETTKTSGMPLVFDIFRKGLTFEIRMYCEIVCLLLPLLLVKPNLSFSFIL